MADPGVATDDWRPTCSLAALRARADLLATLRAFFAARDVLEAQTAILASATITDAAIESVTVTGVANGYLQTSPEYQLKRLLAAGAPSLYQLGPVFRAGEAGRLHNPEFTLLEWYRLGFDDDRLMAEVADLVDRVLGQQPYERLTYAQVVGAVARPRGELDLAYADATAALRGRRVFVVDFPADQAALARLREGNPELAARFELIIDGVEIANGYHEAQDPELLERRFRADQAARVAAGLPVPPIDERFLGAMRAGLPDCSGVALGVDRLLMQKLGARHIHEVMPFPQGRA